MADVNTFPKLFSFLSNQLGMAEVARALAGGRFYTFLPVPVEALPPFSEDLFEEKGTWDDPSFEDQGFHGESCWGSTTQYETPIMAIFGGAGYVVKEIYTSSMGEVKEIYDFFWAEKPCKKYPKWGSISSTPLED